MVHEKNETAMDWKMKKIIRGMGLSKCPLVALLIVSAICAPYIAQAGGKISKPKPVRAERTRGVRCQLLPNKSTWQSDEKPKFKAYVQDERGRSLQLVNIPGLGCLLEVDGLWHRCARPKWVMGHSYYPSDWMTKGGGYMLITMDKRYWQSVTDGKPLDMTPGKHTVRFAWAEHERQGPIRLVSKPVQIEILPSSKKDIESDNFDKHRKRVIDLFYSFVVAEDTLTEADKKAGLKFNITRHANWFPRFTWEDIPVLLELAESDKLMEGMPKLNASSYIGRYCREGMVALWFIEGLRKKQTALVRQTQTGDTPHGTYYHLPLNPICIKEPQDDYANLQACEKSPQVLQETLEAYRQWWRMVGSLPPAEAAVFYPLDLTDLQWFGGGRQLDPLEIYAKMTTAGTAARRTIRAWKYTGSDYQPGQILQTIYYKLKDASAPGPFTKEMLAVQKVVLRFYDEDGREIRTKSIVPSPRQP